VKTPHPAKILLLNWRFSEAGAIFVLMSRRSWISTASPQISAQQERGHEKNPDIVCLDVERFFPSGERIRKSAGIFFPELLLPTHRNG
jgi:hypothetical protein